jgi:hypothetical protein
MTDAFEEVVRELSQRFDGQLQHIGQTQQKLCEPFIGAWWVVNHLRVVLLHVSQLSMTVCANRNPQRGIEMAAGYVMLMKTAVIAFAAAGADGVVRTQVLKACLTTALSCVFKFIHGFSPRQAMMR